MGASILTLMDWFRPKATQNKMGRTQWVIGSLHYSFWGYWSG